MQVSNPTLFRQNIREKMAALIPKDFGEKYPVNLEIGIFNYAIREATQLKLIKKWENPNFVTLYVNRLRTIYTNLQNPDLITMLKMEEISAPALAFMTHQEMNPAHWKDMIDRKMKRDAAKYSTHVEAMTDMFVCKKCKSRRCTYYELQTRSADEPSTIFISCVDCGKHWKQ
jgi:transcription elongation factor S-II